MNSKMTYEKEIDQLIRESFFEDWMDEDDYNELISVIFDKTRKEDLNSAIEEGVANGYSVEFQINILKSMWL